MAAKRTAKSSRRSPSKKKRAATKGSQATTSSRSVNKSAWIRSQPPGMSAAEVVKKAKAEGITLSPAQVYTARSTAKKRGIGPTAERAARSASGPRSPASDRAGEFRQLVLRLGIDRAEELLAGLKREFGV